MYVPAGWLGVSTPTNETTSSPAAGSGSSSSGAASSSGGSAAASRGISRSSASSGTLALMVSDRSGGSIRIFSAGSGARLLLFAPLAALATGFAARAGLTGAGAFAAFFAAGFFAAGFFAFALAGALGLPLLVAMGRDTGAAPRQVKEAMKPGRTPPG